MDAKLAFKYDREADILRIEKCPPYPVEESEELDDDVVARLNTTTREVENMEVQFGRFPHAHNQRHAFRATSPVTVLMPTINQWREW
jgi:hypothetical protein